MDRDPLVHFLKFYFIFLDPYTVLRGRLIFVEFRISWLYKFLHFFLDERPEAECLHEYVENRGSLSDVVVIPVT